MNDKTNGKLLEIHYLTWPNLTPPQGGWIPSWACSIQSTVTEKSSDPNSTGNNYKPKV